MIVLDEDEERVGDVRRVGEIVRLPAFLRLLLYSFPLSNERSSGYDGFLQHPTLPDVLRPGFQASLAKLRLQVRVRGW